MHPVTSYRHASLTLVLAVTICVSGCASPVQMTPATPSAHRQTEQPIGTLISCQRVNAIRRGMSREQVASLLEARGKHQFTFLKDGVVYLTVEYDVDPGLGLWFLYRDGYLWKIVDWQRPDMEEYPYRGTTASKLKSWDITVQSRLEKVIAAPDLTASEIDREVASFKTDLAKAERSRDPWAVMPAFILIAPLMLPELIITAVDRARNAKLANKLDGLRVVVGMTVVQVDDVYGAPEFSRRLEREESVRIYGHVDESLNVSPELLYSPVAVLFDRGKVVGVYSHTFLDPDWCDKNWASKPTRP